MKKVDVFALSLSIMINLTILFLMTAFGTKEVTGKIKVGLVALENANQVNYEGKKDTTGKVPVVPPKEKPPEVVEKKDPKPSVEKELTLEDKLKELQIAAPKIETLSNKGAIVKKENKKSSSAPSDEGYMEAPIKTIGAVSGIPSGYKLGSPDGDIMAKWDSKNRNPEYPQSAQLRGLNGTVRLRLTIDEYGNVRGVSFEKDSGVPEINLAIEKVARTWKIPLTKKGKTVYGDVILEYNFKLTGN